MGWSSDDSNQEEVPELRTEGLVAVGDEITLSSSCCGLIRSLVASRESLEAFGVLLGDDLVGESDIPPVGQEDMDVAEVLMWPNVVELLVFMKDDLGMDLTREIRPSGDGLDRAGGTLLAMSVG